MSSYFNVWRCYLFVFVFSISQFKELRRLIYKCRQTADGRGMSLRQRTKRNSYGSDLDCDSDFSLHEFDIYVGAFLKLEIIPTYFDCDSSGVLVRWRISDSTLIITNADSDNCERSAAGYAVDLSRSGMKIDMDGGCAGKWTLRDVPKWDNNGGFAVKRYSSS